MIDDGNFNAALLDCVQRGSVGELELLLQNDHPDMIDLDGKTLLHYAAESNNVSITRHFINNNHDVDIRNNRGNSPLMLAAQRGSYDTAKLLVEAGANIDDATILSNKRNPEAEYSAYVKYHEFLKAILRQLYEVLGNDEQLLFTRLHDFGCSLFDVISLGDANLIRLMQRNGHSVDDRDLGTNATSLHMAVYLGDLEHVRVLLEFGASVHALDNRDFTPLHYLFDRPSESREDDEGRVEIMTILREHGALSNKTPDDPILYILRFGKLLAVTALMLGGVSINSPAYLSSLVDNADDCVVKAMCKQKINVNSVYFGLSLLSRAIGSGRIKKVDFLLELGADPNFDFDSGRQTPLSRAFTDLSDQESILPIVRLLLQYGADAQYVITDENQERKTVFDLENSSGEVIESVISHLALIESCGVTISHRIRGKIDSQDIYKQHFQVCEQQIEEMKNTTVYGKVTLYKLLTESHLSITRYARNPQFAPNFEEAMQVQSNWDPYFLIFLRKRVQKAIPEAQLYADVVVVINQIFLKFNIIYDICVKISEYLTDDDATNICKVFDR